MGEEGTTTMASSTTTTTGSSSNNVFGVANALIGQLKQSLSDRNAKISELQRSLSKAFSANKSIEKELYQTKQELETLKAKFLIVELEKTDALVALRKQFEDSLHNTSTTTTTTSSIISSSSRSSTRGKGSKTSVPSSLCLLEHDLEDAKIRIDILEEENDFLRSTKLNLEDEVHELESHVEALKDRVVEEEERNATLEMEVSEFESIARQWMTRCEIAEYELDIEKLQQQQHDGDNTNKYNNTPRPFDRDVYEPYVNYEAEYETVGKRYYEGVQDSDSILHEPIVENRRKDVAPSSSVNNVSSNKKSNRKHQKFWETFNNSLHDNSNSSSISRRRQQKETFDVSFHNDCDDDEDYDDFDGMTSTRTLQSNQKIDDGDFPLTSPKSVIP